MARRINRAIVAACVVAVIALVGAIVVGSGGGTDTDSDDDVGDGGSAQGGDCVRRGPADWSAARIWNEALLSAIRLDVPSPTVHARNLFHTSAAMWDAWAAFDPVARGVFVDEAPQTHGIDVDPRDPADIAAAREEAISHAAYGILVPRYLLSPGAEESVTGFDQLMADLCHDRFFTGTEGDSPAALGNRIAATILAETLDDGSNEAGAYVAPDYAPVNPPLVVAEAGTTMIDPNRWQPLELDVMVSQSGLPLDETVQTFVGPHWGEVTPFALEVPPDRRPAFNPGPPPCSATRRAMPSSRRPSPR